MNEEQRPIFKLKLAHSDKVLEISSYLLLFVLCLMVGANYSSLPERIPIHYNGSGKVDAYGSKDTIFFGPILCFVVFVVLTYLSAKPHLFNYIEKINELNAEKQYTIASRMLRILKLVLVFVFLIIEYKTIQITKGDSEVLGNWFVPLVMSMIVLPLGYYFLSISKIIAV